MCALAAVVVAGRRLPTAMWCSTPSGLSPARTWVCMPGREKGWVSDPVTEETAVPVGVSVAAAAPGIPAARMPSTVVATAAAAASDRVRRRGWHHGMGLSGGSVPAAPRSGAYLLIRFGPTPLDDPFGGFTHTAQCRRPQTCATPL